MGTQPGASVDAWLREGGLVVASSDRAARAILAAFHRRRRSEGLKAWPAPRVADWNAFARTAWEERNSEGHLLLNAAQELAIWSEIVRSDQYLPTALPASIRRLAAMAMEAHELICAYTPRLLRDEARAGWEQDAGAFSGWLSEFNKECRKKSLSSTSRVPLELITYLRDDSSPREPVRLAGFDRILPVQRELFDVWGPWHVFESESIGSQTHFYSAPDGQTEVEACAFWCQRQLAEHPERRILVITQEQAQRRGEIERAFLRFGNRAGTSLFEFSLGAPLTQIPLVRSALLLLRWLHTPLSETELDWLFASGFAANDDESSALQLAMRLLRSRDEQRPRWELQGFLNHAPASALPQEWGRRLITAQRSLKEQLHSQSPVSWADKVSGLLAEMGWRGALPQNSIEFQQQRRWTQAIDTAGSLGFDGRRLTWTEFLAELEHAAGEILFAPQSADAPIQIAGPAESAGLTADAIWFLGADEESWPAVASTHPFLPLHVQREYGMPHSSHLADWEFSKAITTRLLASAPSVHFSFASHKGDVESRPSRLMLQMVGEAAPIPQDMLPPPHETPATYATEDFSRIPYTGGHLHGGSAVLSAQSQCPFKAFATARLGARSWDPAENGLNAKQRGQILHDVLHSIWSGRPKGIRSHGDLMKIDTEDLPKFVRKHVNSVMEAGVPGQVREQMPAMYLDLEESRLTRLITEWLLFETRRVPFTVDATEAKSAVTIAGLNMNLRLDRVDRLHDGSQLVVDYKTGTVDPKAWDLPRPDDVQLPLYKLFGLAPLQRSLFDSYAGPASGGLVFARVRTGDTCFAGRVADAKGTLDPDLKGNSLLVKRKLTSGEEDAWKGYIESLAEEFVRGRAEVDPRDYPKTCEQCGLQPVCRIQEPENRRRFEKPGELQDGEQIDAPE
ncbi:PD-(D/E)XK nuclease family protein [Occallatibacter savannae]|uniref:PD-(D/E)XK nuclease family protein n=1 Tax=Occallatibacter savannae TaxID=1002691 RepID=UPI000D68A68C|nr:PD-(D/E)XK nuclease family protein [Occallatibacter savannae]